MSELATGTAPSPEHAPQGTPTEPNTPQTPANPQAPTQPNPAAQTPSAPNVEQLLEAERQRASQLEERYRNLQGAFTQTRQQMAALTGQQPQADPLAPYIQQLVSQGYDEKDARAIAGVSHSMIAPLQQQLATSQAALTNQTMVDDVLRSAYSRDQQTLSDPEVWRIVEQNVRQEAINAARTGQPWDPSYAQEYALRIAWQTKGELNLQRAANPQTPPPTQPPVSPFQRGITGIPGNFSPAPAQQQQTVTRSPEQQKISDLLAERMKPKQ